MASAPTRTDATLVRRLQARGVPPDSVAHRVVPDPRAPARSGRDADVRLPSGTIVATADYARTVAEANEDNNTATRVVTCLGLT